MEVRRGLFRLFFMALAGSHLPPVLLVVVGGELKLSVTMLLPFICVFFFSNRPLAYNESVPAVPRTPRPISPLGLSGMLMAASIEPEKKLPTEATVTGGGTKARDSMVGVWPGAPGI